MLRILAGAFLIAHGLVHVAIWVPRTKEPPFDVNHSPLFGDVRGPALSLATLYVTRSSGHQLLAQGVWDVGRDFWPCPSADGKRKLTVEAECLSAQGRRCGPEPVCPTAHPRK